MNRDTVLKEVFGYSAFRQGQGEIIDAVLAGRDVLGIMPTGAGKSLCYQVPALMLPGVTLVVSPLISLMKDQVGSLLSAGVKAAYLNSTLTAAQYREALRRASLGAYKIIYIAPERLLTEAFLALACTLRVSLVTVDEAHCVSQWGQDFRPSYLQIADFVARLPTRPPVAAFTATATDKVRADIVEMLGLRQPHVAVTGFDRPNLYFEVRTPHDKTRELLRILRERRDRSGIVYCATRKSVEEVCEHLRHAGYAAAPYHAGMGDRDRHTNQEDFLHDRVTIMVATNAFGMGIDKSNVSFVIHYNMPKNLESYYQEAGRAGRDGEPADCILLYSGQDVRINQFLINRSMQDAAELTPQEREALQRKDLELLKRMTWYSTTKGCLRGYILRYFGEDAPARCGACGTCLGHEAEVLSHTDVDCAKLIVTCVYQLARRGMHLNRTALADVLRGGRRTATRRMALNTLPTFGVLSACGAKALRAWMDDLVRDGYLASQSGQGAVLMLTEKSQEMLGAVLAEDETVRAAIVAQSTRQGGLLERLRAVRSNLARMEGVPAYYIFTDATLRDMCDQLPQDAEELLRVSGVGTTKLARYGEAFLAVLRVPESEADDAAEDGEDTAQGAQETHRQGAKSKTAPASAHQPWKPQEDEQLRAEHADGHSVRKMAQAHARTGGAIRMRLIKLGLEEG